MAGSKQFGGDDREGGGRDRRLDADNPLQSTEAAVQSSDIGFGGEFTLSVADGLRERFGLAAVEACGFEVTGPR